MIIVAEYRSDEIEGCGMSDEVLCEIAAGVAVITINRPEARNALNRAVRYRLPEIITELDATKVPERSGRAMDHESEDAFERLRVSGYL
jgi:enoyl-CoA hydratase/carnithine racemase